MKTSIIILALSLSAAGLGCDTKPATKAEQPVEINAPGVQVKVSPKAGVEVKAPGVDVETK